ncbi:carbohydrate kinase [Mucilaginibacter daejeonensis]|uniref:FGGY-family carbohydrate kinase n=1 Tax=Mucilaginibacter daejeonensis TaxID=398049 RepID=UPI001D17C21A|nr:FGGY family carbohydrate kinase [Mucilaginibacter daejeonensis]UEG52824.1 carbohydrate kinase [Mucilaginibacter daejeonensis]
MTPIPVIAVFDVGKTNKKLFLFNEDYKIVYERSARFNETTDEDGDPCENIDSLRLSVFDSLREIFKRNEFEVKAVNFSSYGASFVYLDEHGTPLTPLYNYLKTYPENLHEQFYATYGGEARVARETASPVLGSLNSGLQLYRLKYKQPEVFERIKYALHLPQYLSYLISGEACTDLTSIGCHTGLWDFEHNRYHEWVTKEGLAEKLAPICDADTVRPAAFPGNNYSVGIGLHDSSAALIPYLVSFTEPFVLLSTGTWTISLNPFDNSPLTDEELKADCLNFIQYKGKPVKASRLFAGYEYEQQVKRIAAHFDQNIAHYRTIRFNPDLVARLQAQETEKRTGATSLQASVFGQRDLASFANDEEAYHRLMLDIVDQQKISTGYVLKDGNVKRIFVDGGFSKNSVYMHLLAAAFPHTEVFAASMAQATAVGAALAIHNAWNTKPLPHDLLELKFYSATQGITT